MTTHSQHPGHAGSDGESADALESRFGGRFLTAEAPSERLPQAGMPAIDAMRLIGEELLLDGIPMRNLATFVTTWMEPEATADHPREPPSQLHRPRRVPEDGGDRATLHPDARAPVPCAGGDDRRPDAGVV